MRATRARTSPCRFSPGSASSGAWCTAASHGSTDPYTISGSGARSTRAIAASRLNGSGSPTGSTPFPTIATHASLPRSPSRSTGDTTVSASAIDRAAGGSVSTKTSASRPARTVFCAATAEPRRPPRSRFQVPILTLHRPEERAHHAPIAGLTIRPRCGYGNHVLLRIRTWCELPVRCTVPTQGQLGQQPGELHGQYD